MIAVKNLWDTATTINATAAITSEAIDQVLSEGYSALLVVLTGTTKSVNITLTVGRSATDTFYSPVDIMGTAISTLYSGLAATAWIQFPPVIAPFFKITITGTATNGSDTTAKAYLMFKEEL